jgi:flagellin-like hook-associated protein FlgL
MFSNHLYNTSYQLGTYMAIAQMMRREIRNLDAAQDDFDREWAMRNLRSLADQLDEAEEKMKKEVDTVAA